MSSVEDVLGALESVLAEHLGRVFSADSCIASTRVVLKVLECCELAVHPLVVECAVFNAGFLRRVEEEGWPRDGETLRAWTDEGDAWSVGIGRRGEAPSGPDRWPGHLVAIVEDRWLVDATLGQAGRPDRDLYVPEVLVAEVSASFLAGEEPHSAYVATPVGDGFERGLAVYKAYPGATDYQEAPDWRAERWDRVVRDVWSRLQLALMEDSP